MLTSIVCMLVTGITIIIYERHQIKKDLVNDLSALALLIADRSTAALTFQDPRLAIENVSALHVKPEVEAACILDEKGDVFAQYNTVDFRKLTFPGVDKHRGHRFLDEHLLLFEPVSLGGRQIGTVCIYASLEDFYHQQHYFMLLVVVIILFSSMLAFYLSSRLQLVVSRPLQQLTKTAQLIAAKKDYSLRAAKSSDDEIGILVDAFNEMLEMIEKQNVALKDSESHYRYLFEKNPLPMLIYELGTLNMLAVNDAFMSHYGYAKTEALALRLIDLYPETEKKPIADLSKKLQGRAYAGEWHHLKKNGTQITVEVYSDGISYEGRASRIAVLADVTKRKETERALHESERKYRELVEHANSIILRWTHDGRITFLNEFGLRFFGYSAEEIIGRHVMGTIVPTSDSGGRELRQLMDQIFADPVVFEQNVNENMRRNGERVWVAWTNRIVRDVQGQVAEIQSVGTDITELKRAEEAIRELNTSLEQRVVERTAELAVARDRAEAADRTKSAFLATMSHELRTPLNSIIGFTGLLLQGLAGPLNAEQTKQLRMVKDSGQHLLALINDVLDISKIEAGQIEIANAPFDLPESIHKVVETVTPLADKKRLPLTAQIAPDVSRITSDRRRVEQILLNLLSNAIKFTEQGEVTLTAEIVPGMPRSALRISVADTGLGIKRENLDKLFQPFRQLDTGLTRQHEGTGLGLAICKRLVERLGGTITVESEWGKGSTFQCTLPIDPERKS